MTVELSDVEAERLAVILDDHVLDRPTGTLPEGVRPDSHMFRDELRYRQDGDPRHRLGPLFTLDDLEAAVESVRMDVDVDGSDGVSERVLNEFQALLDQILDNVVDRAEPSIRSESGDDHA